VRLVEAYCSACMGMVRRHGSKCSRLLGLRICDFTPSVTTGKHARPVSHCKSIVARKHRTCMAFPWLFRVDVDTRWCHVKTQHMCALMGMGFSLSHRPADAERLRSSGRQHTMSSHGHILLRTQKLRRFYDTMIPGLFISSRVFGYAAQPHRATPPIRHHLRLSLRHSR
jgi:hypothetical protein